MELSPQVGDLRRMVRLGGAVAWLMVGVPVLIGHQGGPARLLGWAAAWVLFLALFLASRHRVALVAQVGCVLALVLLLCDGFEGALLVLVALQLGGLVSRRAGLLWIGGQTALLALAVGVHWTPWAALLITPPWLGFQVLAFFLADLLAREARARLELSRLQGQLAASSRLEERLRISHELHDAVGHHLTALRLNLEVAARTAEGRAREPVAAAQGIAQLLIAEVRRAVDQLGEPERLDLGSALRALVEEMPRPRIHLSLPASLQIGGGAGALIVLRCAQEIATNAARHAGAENLWLEISEGAGLLELKARDDGRGAAEVRAGSGLRGLRERLERAGGALTIATSPGAGFTLCASLPLSPS
jgi:signal transduction histidine kinase